MTIDIEQIDPKLLDLDRGELSLFSMRWILEFNSNPSDEIISWLINRPPIYAAKEDDEMKARMEAHARDFIAKKEESIKITKLIKQEFYDFLCTKSKTYSNERSLMNGNINTLISGLAAAIATQLSGIKIGIIVSFVTFFFMLTAKMTKRIACKYLEANG